jgi:hypothetical protein
MLLGQLEVVSMKRKRRMRMRMTREKRGEAWYSLVSLHPWWEALVWTAVYGVFSLRLSFDRKLLSFYSICYSAGSSRRGAVEPDKLGCSYVYVM